MRGAILTLIVTVLCAFALVKPKIGVLGYTWFALMRPDVLSWAGGRPYSLALAVCTLTGSLPYVWQFGILLGNWISRWLILFLIPISVSTMLAVDPSLSWPAWQYYVRIVAMALLIPVFIRTERDLKSLLIVIGASIGFLGLKLGSFGMLGGDSQYIDALEGTMMSDNNMLALALAMAVPLCWYSGLIAQRKYVRLGFFGLAFGSVAGVVMTNSRGGALSVSAAILLIALRSKRKAVTAIALVLFIAPAVYVVRDTYIARLSSITTDEDKADGSIKGRLNHRRAAFEMWKDYPWFGVGFGMQNYAVIAPQYLGYDDFHVAHNTYFQFLADDGAIAFLIYIWLLFGTILWLQKSARRAAVETPGKELYPIAIQTSLVAFAVGSYFLSRDSYDLLYITLMAAAGWRTVQLTGAWESGSEESGKEGHPERVAAGGSLMPEGSVA